MSRKKIASICVSGALIAALAIGLEAPAFAEAVQPDSAMTSSGIDLRPVKTKLENGKVKISRDNGATWADYIPQKTATTNVKSSEDYGDDLQCIKEGLSALTKLSDIPGLDDVAGALFDKIFPDQNAEQIASSLSKINADIQNIEGQLQEDYEQIIDNQNLNTLQGELNNFEQNAQPYETAAQLLLGDVNTINNEPDSSKKEADMQHFLNVTVPQSAVGSQSIVSTAVTFGGFISGNTNILGLYNQEAIYEFKWENQGYETREAFQADALSTFTALTAIAELELSEEQNNGVSTASTDFSYLQTNISDVNKTVGKEAVVERPSYERYYQVPGHECLLAAAADARQVNPNFPSGWSGDFNDYENQLRNNQFVNLFTYQSPLYENTRFVNTNPTANWLKEIYADYGNNEALYHIFFDQDKGNIAAGSNVADGEAFITNDEQFKFSKHDPWLGAKYADFTESATVAADDSNSKLVKLAEGEIGGPDGWDYYDDQPNVNFIGLAVLNQGVTPVDFTPSTAAKIDDTENTSHTSSSSSNKATSSQSSISSTSPASSSSSTSSVPPSSPTAVQNPYTGDNEQGNVQWIPFALLTAIISGIFIKKNHGRKS